MSTGLQTVHVRVNDTATGKPTPCRIRLTSPDGSYHAPLGRPQEFATGSNQDVGGSVLLGMNAYTFIDGTCEIPLPAGTILVEAHKGPEYVPLRQEVTLAPGQLSLRLALERWTNLRQARWYSGDTRAHFLTPHAALLEAAAEDVAVVNLLATEYQSAGSEGREHGAFSNLLAFSGQQPALEMPGHLVVVNTHNAHPILGSLGLLHCHRVVYPLTFGGPAGLDNWTLADWCGQCHRKGGLVVWTRVWYETGNFRYGEPLADLILGKVDALELDSLEDSTSDILADWYTLLNCGFRVPLVGASGKESNGMVLGSPRTYARLQAGEELSCRTWIEAVRAGRTFVTNGPILSVTVDGLEPGAVWKRSNGGTTAHVRAEALSGLPFDCLEVVANGEVLASASAGDGFPTKAVIEANLPIAAGGWLAARCRGARTLGQRPASQQVFAHSAPVYLEIEGQPRRADPAAAKSLAAHLEQMLRWANHDARCDTERQRERLAEVFQTARLELLRRVDG